MPTTRRPGALLGTLADRVAPLAVLAAVLALVVPSHAVARRSDLLLAALVLVTALGISPRRLLTLRVRGGALLLLAIVPLLALTTVGWLLSRPFNGAVGDGILALGLSCSEVASVGLVALAGGDAVLALGVLTGSLIASAILGPLLAGALGHTTGHVHTLGLLGRFALVVLAPLLVGLLARGTLPRLQRADNTLAGLSAVIVCALVYAALSGLAGGHQLPAAALGAVLFLLAGGLLALAAVRLISSGDPADVALPVGMRDFAVAAALATQAFGTTAATVPGIYGVLMLIAGATTATMFHRRGHDPRHGRLDGEHANRR